MRLAALSLIFAIGCTEHGRGGGIAGCDCAADQFCNFTRNSCGTGEIGVCLDRPTSCPGFVDAVCGCDGQVYSNDCVAAGNGVDVDASGACAVPENDFACGFHLCRQAIEFCVVTTSDVGDPTNFACGSVPPACTAQPTCECLANEGVACAGVACSSDASNDITVSCLGG